MEKLSQCHNQREQMRRFDMNQDDCENENCASTRFLQIQENQLNELQEQLKRKCIIIPAFSVNNAKHDFHSLKSYLLPILFNERYTKPTVINQFISFKFGDFQVFDMMNLLGGAISLVSFLKAYKTSEI